MMKLIFLAFLFSLLSAIPAFAQTNQCVSGLCVCPDFTSPCVSGWTYGTVLSSTAELQLWPSDGSRKELTIENQVQSTGNLCVAFGKNVAGYGSSVCNGHLLEPHEALVMSNRGTSNNYGNVDTQVVTVYCTTGSCAFSYYFSD